MPDDICSKCYATTEQSNEILLYAINQQTSHHLFINSKYAARLDLGILDGEWHHVCITWTSGRGSWNIYVDGQVKANGTDIATGHRVPRNGIMVLGQDQDRLGGGFQKFQAYTGDVSGVNMWSKEFTSAEIDEVMAGCQKGDVIGWSPDDWQLGGAAQSSSYRCGDRLTTLRVNVGEHFDMSENRECGRTDNDLNLAEHGHVITIDCQEPIVGRYVSIQLVGRTDFLTLCEVEVFTATVDGTRLADLTARHALTLNSWNFIGATYSSSSGAVQLWHGGLEVASTVVGREEMAVGGTVRAGFSDDVGGSFRGKVACVQLYDVSLNQDQIEKAASRCTGGNIALGKTTSLSSAWPGLPASLAVDGYTSGVVTSSGDCVHTDREKDPWFKVDLGGIYPVGRVRIYSRGECCGEHLTFPPPLSAQNYALLRLNGNDTLDEFTLCFRMRTDARVSGTIVSYATTEQSNEILLYAINQQTSHHLFINSKYAARLDLGILDGEWHHVCITWTSGRGSWNIYVDGQVKANGTDIATGHRVPRNGIMVLGQDQDRLGGGFQKFQAYTGDVSGVNMWSKEFTSAEIDEVMAGCQKGDVIGWSPDDWQLGGAAQSSSYRCGDRLTTLRVNVGEHFDMSENPECGRTDNDLNLAEHGHVITIDCQEPIIGRYVTIQLVGRTDFLTLCEVEVFTATVTPTAGWVPANTSWPIDSSGTPYFDGVTVFDAAKVFDGNMTTFWNPTNLPFMYDSWNIVFDMQRSYWLYKIRVISPVELTEEQHYPTSLELLVSDDVEQGGWSTVGTFSMAGRQTLAYGGFIAYSRYWKLLITSTISGFQPYISEVQVHGNTGQ
uniref:Uncharacterized protein n=1 Tax=Branchiostoma floridae TaxID=7739 RepID=C3Y4Z0_BRAFL|eukprot:XP_002608513.1 hypothetical protein BRAFLDRAFT_92405 [Branchiostoma floridae]